MKVLDLFSGIGGFSLGLERAGMETVAFCEYDKKAQLVLKKHWPDIPIYDDVRELTWKKYVQDVKLRQSGVAVESKPIVSHVIQNRCVSGETKTENAPEKIQGSGQKRRKTGSCGSMEESVSVVEKQMGLFSPLTTNLITETPNDNITNPKHGRSLSKEDTQTTTKSSVTTVTTPKHTTEFAHINQEYRVDVITAGVPCQPASQAGKRGGEGDNRWLWPEALRIISEFHPRWCILENVYGLITLNEGMAFENLCVALEEEGYEVQSFIIPACAVNAPHRRDRVWIIANAQNQRDSGENDNGKRADPDREIRVSRKSGGICGEGYEDVAHANGSYVEGGGVPGGVYEEDPIFISGGDDGRSVNDVAHAPEPRQQEQGKPFQPYNQEEAEAGQTVDAFDGSIGDFWAIEPNVGRVADGVSGRVDGHWDIEPEDIPRVATGVKGRIDRLEQLGNAVVPQVVEQIGVAIMQIERRIK